MIEVKDLTLKFDGKYLYRNFSMHVERGHKVTLSGGSGTGKTTFLNLLLGFLPAEHGEILVFGKKLNTNNIHFIRSQIAYVPQELNLPLNSVEEAIYMPFQFKNNRDFEPSKDKIADTLSALNLNEEILKKNMDEISGGQKQRIAISTALLLEKPLLILDEPTSALDEKTIEMVINRVLKNSKQTVLSTSHSKLWTEHSDKTYNLDNHGKDA